LFTYYSVSLYNLKITYHCYIHSYLAKLGKKVGFLSHCSCIHSKISSVAQLYSCQASFSSNKRATRQMIGLDLPSEFTHAKYFHTSWGVCTMHRGRRGGFVLYISVKKSIFNLLFKLWINNMIAITYHFFGNEIYITFWAMILI
jgi:hypothetical protein